MTPCSSLRKLSPTLLLCLAVAGCIPAVIAHKVLGPPTVPAQYVPAQEPLVVLAENYQNPALAAFEAERLTHNVSELLRKRKVAPMVDEGALARLRLGRNTRNLRIAEVGKAVGAKQVVYLDIRQCAVDELSGTGYLKGQMTVYVRVVDADTGALRWPTRATDGFPLSVETAYQSPGPDLTENLVRQQLCDTIAVQVARLFYDHKPDDDDSRE